MGALPNLFMFFDQITHIDTFRVSTTPEEAAGVRLAAASLLERMDWHIAGVPPSAILMVRRLEDPLPGKFDPSCVSLQVDASWEKAVKKALRTLYDSAIRPSNGILPSNASAVVFKDKSEMFACMALDLAKRRADQVWLWKVPLRRIMGNDLSVFRLLSQAASLVPAIMAQLSRWDCAMSVVRTLSIAEAEEVIDAVAAAYGIEGQLKTREWPPPPLLTTTPTAAADEQKLAQDGRIQRPENVFGDHLSYRTLHPVQAYILALSLKLHKTPALTNLPTMQALGITHQVFQEPGSPLPATHIVQEAPSVEQLTSDKGELQPNTLPRKNTMADNDADVVDTPAAKVKNDIEDRGINTSPGVEANAGNSEELGLPAAESNVIDDHDRLGAAIKPANDIDPNPDKLLSSVGSRPGHEQEALSLSHGHDGKKKQPHRRLHPIVQALSPASATQHPDPLAAKTSAVNKKPTETTDVYKESDGHILNTEDEAKRKRGRSLDKPTQPDVGIEASESSETSGVRKQGFLKLTPLADDGNERVPAKVPGIDERIPKDTDQPGPPQPEGETKLNTSPSRYIQPLPGKASKYIEEQQPDVTQETSARPEPAADERPAAQTPAIESDPLSLHGMDKSGHGMDTFEDPSSVQGEVAETKDPGNPATGGGANNELWGHQNIASASDAVTPEQGHRLVNSSIGPHTGSSEDGFRSELCGAFFLINLITHLDLFTHAKSLLGISGDLSPWGGVEVLTRTFMPPDHDDLIRDPVWTILAALDMRESGTYPQWVIQEQHNYLLPSAWIAHLNFADTPHFSWASEAGRLYVWSNTGISIAEVTQNHLAPADHATQLLAELGVSSSAILKQAALNHAPFTKFNPVFVDGLDPSLRSGVGFMLPFLGTRLCQALGLESRSPEALAEALLFHTGTVFVTQSHVDIVLPLEAVSVSIRSAGLDRDPGWYPDFGRVIQFHYE